MKKPLHTFLLGLLILGALSPVWLLAAEMGTALKPDTLRAEPFADAKTVANLSKNESVEILGKKGAWLNIKTKTKTGWVRILSVKRGAASSSNTVAGVVDVATGRAGTGKVVSTTGIRGLSAEDLKAAKFNEAEVAKMDSYAVSRVDADTFATAGGLITTKLSYFSKGAK
jgi:Bacterial SH3 domain